MTGPSWRVALATALDVAGSDGLAARSVQTLARESALVREDADLQELARRSTAANIALVADVARRDLALADYEPPPPAVAFARELARRNVSMTELALAYRVAQRTLWRFGVEALRERMGAEVIAACIEDYTDATFATGDVLMGRALERYVMERDRWVRSAGAVRRATLDDILAGRAVDLGQASARLGYELRREHAGFVVWGDADDALLEAAASAVGGAAALVVVLRTGVVAGWCPVAQLTPEAAPDQHVAVGLPGGFKETHEQALEARRVAKLARRPPGLTRYEDCALAALLTHDPAQARAFALRELQALAEPEHQRLAETVLAVLRSQGSPRRAAARLGLHENTVAKRVRAAEELLGRPLDARPAETLAALLVLPAYQE